MTTIKKTNPQILIAADTLPFGRAIAAFLSAQDHPFTMVNDAREALQRALEGNVDICLLENQLPPVDGSPIWDQIAQADSGPTIVRFSHHPEPSHGIMEDRSTHFLQIPCTPAQLLDLVQGLTESTSTILLVDDSRVIHTIVGDVLEDEGFELLHAFDANEGFEKAVALRPNLIISDIDMPGTDGYEFCRRVKETAETAHIPVIMQSTRKSGLDIDRGFDAGANDYLTKPVNPDEMLTRIRQILHPHDDRKRETVLVVDDSRTTRNFMSQGLAQQSFNVIAAADGQEGLAAAVQKKPDLIVTDLEMPIMDGRSMTREIRKHESLSDTPIIMLTASSSIKDEAKGRHAGVSAYLSKPFPPDKLVVLVEQLIAERKLLVERGELQNRNQFIRDVFGRYMAEDVVKTLLESDDALRLGGEHRKVTVLMSDLRGFTAMSEVLSPKDVVSLLNDYLEAMTNIIVKYRGTIDDFIGDAIVTVFGAPISGTDDAHRAVACALEMQLAMTTVNQRNQQNGYPEIEMGIGLDTGEVIVGNIGSRRRAKYSVIGSHVNMAARVESFTVGGQVLISENTLHDIEDVVKIGRRMTIEPKGAKAPMTICEVIGMGPPYQISLPGGDNEPLQLAVPMPCRYRKIEKKVMGKHVYPGQVVSLTDKAILVAGAGSPEMFSDLRIEIDDPDTGANYSDIYAKLVEKPDADRAWLHLTAVPDEAAAFLLTTRQSAATRTQ